MTTTTETREHTLHPGDAAPNVPLLDGDGKTINLADLWSARPTLFYFLRHFGCALCRDHLRAIQQVYPQLQQRGAEVVTITFADADGAFHFRYRNHLPFPVLADPLRRAYRGFGVMEGSFGDALGPNVLARQAVQALRGNMPYANPLDPALKQLGGVFIVDRTGTVQLAHLAIPIYNYPKVEQYFLTLDSLKSQ